jgi:RNA polymerase sigma factor (sigma-70 family)
MATTPNGGALRQIERLFAEGRTASLPDGELLERFLSEGDEAAFTALVERHGPMVLGTCRAVLRDPNAAEDAFQATFLVLIYKARSIRGHGDLASWLYQVAHRIALQAGAEAALRRTRERHIGETRLETTIPDEPDDAWREILHEELARLSDKYRLPLMLCELEGKTHAQAARELNCGEATVRRRLAAARDLLRSRLSRRGVTLTAVDLAAAFGRSANAAVPAAWIKKTVKAAVAFSSRAARIAIGEVVSTTAADLARRSLRAMLLSQLRAGSAAIVFLIALGGIAWGVGTYGQDKPGAGQPPRMQGPGSTPVASPERSKAENPADPDEFIIYQGRVLDPDGHPFPGAKLYLVSHGLKQPDKPPERATSDADGRFRFMVSKSDFDTFNEEAPWSDAAIIARTTGFAFGLANDLGNPMDLTLKLARDDVPVSGRLIDLQGRPIAGAVVRVISIRGSSLGSLDAWLKAIQERNEVGNLEYEFLRTRIESQPDPPVIPPVRSDADGKFVIAGIGRERVGCLQIEGPTIETKRVHVRTRPGPVLRVPEYKNSQGEPTTIYGATFEHVAGPTRPIEGVVRDLDTKIPLAGIMVFCEATFGNPVDYVQAITDAQGHYRLVGLPRGREGNLLALPPVDFPLSLKRQAAIELPRDEDLPYVRARVKVGEPGGTGTFKLDINLKRGTWVSGRVVEEDTRKPRRAQLEYFVFVDNPHLRDYPDFGWLGPHPHFTGQDGAFHFVAVPGPGVLAARATTDEYLKGVGADAFKHKSENGLLETRPHYAAPSNYHAIVEIDPAPGTASMNRDLLLERGRALNVTVLGPDGKPLTGNQVAGLKDMGYWETPSPEASTYPILSLKPGKGRAVTFLNSKRGLSGELILRGDESKPQTITLQPWGVLIGRVVDSDGQPWSVNAQLYPINFPGGYPMINKDGRFRVEGLIPGKSYTLQLLEKGYMLGHMVVRDVKVGSGEIKDLGDVVPKPPRGQ